MVKITYRTEPWIRQLIKLRAAEHGLNISEYLNKIVLADTEDTHVRKIVENGKDDERTPTSK